MRNFLHVFCLILTLSSVLSAQQNGTITGNLQSNANFFVTDSAIGAFGTPQYDYQKYGAESWLSLNYAKDGFDAGVRFDLFNNSNLINPTESFNGVGIGRWFVQKKIKALTLSGGYLYDQIGSGIIFRAYEERALAIDNALYGVKLAYQINENWQAKVFTGKQKFRFSNYNAVMRGATIEGFIKPDSTRNLSLVPGFGAVARTYAAETVTEIINALAATPVADREGLQNNTYAFTAYNTLNAGNFTWYLEGAYKTKDVMDSPFEPRIGGGNGRLINRTGSVLYTVLSYAQKGLGVSLEGKRTENFNFRAGPFEKGFRGLVNFLPPVARQNTFRLTTRYVPAVQEFGEQAVQLDIKYALSKKWQFGFNTSYIANLDGALLYREFQPELLYKYKRKWQLTSGLQFQYYNQGVFENKNNIVKTVVPYAEWLYKFTPRRSLRTEAQYLHSKDDFGSWAFGLAEVGLAPHWLIYASYMHKLKHKSFTDSQGKPITTENTRLDGARFPSFGVVYSQGANRYSLAWVKQVEGINCAGGICRYEPTFNGLRAQVNAGF